MTKPASEALVEKVALAIERADNEKGYDYDHLGIDHPEISDWGIHLALAAISALQQDGDVERLRDALRDIANSNAALDDGSDYARGWNAARFRMRAIAEAALGQENRRG